MVNFSKNTSLSQQNVDMFDLLNSFHPKYFSYTYIYWIENRESTVIATDEKQFGLEHFWLLLKRVMTCFFFIILFSASIYWQRMCPNFRWKQLMERSLLSLYIYNEKKKIFQTFPEFI